MNSNVQRYRNQLLVARILAGRYSLELIVKEAASTASTNGQRIIYPAAWMLVDNDDVATVMDGIIDHEAAGHPPLICDELSHHRVRFPVVSLSGQRRNCG
ncbi:hypothetical protein LGN19_35725 [Burkholderia sp. AU30198]|uniref:hypothetical protein n=1 Tax=Burkholderia sp. AU30198 TaxID=2879627 RepID=UPI001CF1919E|nr:hypothetical protein [Burkholderia sp. AU30198]MCA8299140.1 hypothetical protein [Burkholderia sp. AU30198]